MSNEKGSTYRRRSTVGVADNTTQAGNDSGSNKPSISNLDGKGKCAELLMFDH